MREKKTNATLWNLAEQLIAEAAKLRSSEESKNGQPAQRLSTAPPLTPALPMNLALAVMVGRRCPHRAVVLCSPPSQRSSPPPGALRTTSPYRQVHGEEDGKRVTFEMGACSALNQSLMELGATVCTPREPKCGNCPVGRMCVAHRNHSTDRIPNLGERVAATPRRFAAFVVQRRNNVLLRQRAGRVVNAQLWEFPNAELALSGTERMLRSAAENELGCGIQSLRHLTTIKHSITRYRITLDVYHAQLDDAASVRRAGSWRSLRQLGEVAFSSAHRRIANALADGSS